MEEEEEGEYEVRIVRFPILSRLHHPLKSNETSLVSVPIVSGND